MNVRIEDSWNTALADQFSQPYFVALTAFIKEQYAEGTVYPPPRDIFHAFDLCPFANVRVIILGQDPYHGAGQAHGLSFSVRDGIRIPPSLKNIYKEIATDIGITPPPSGNLERWATQGVLLLNATLTVTAGSPGSHQGKGWEQFTDAVIATLSAQREHLVFLLWGNYARQKRSLIDTKKHLVLDAPHPSPFSAHTGFFGCKHFSKTNTYLHEHGKTSIEW